jgi:RNA polymerase sigma-70 factor (ECF subfamily)
MSRVKSREDKAFHGGARPRSDASDASDTEIFAAMSAGNLTALGVLYDRHHASIRRFILRASAGSQDTEDLVHDVFLTASRVAGTYDDRAGSRPFLLGIAANIVRSRRQKHARWRVALGLLENALTGVLRRTPEDGASEAEQLRLLNVALARLSEEKRLVLVMIELEELSGEEVATALGIPVATVWTRLHYARAEVREHLKRRIG